MITKKIKIQLKNGLEARPVAAIGSGCKSI